MPVVEIIKAVLKTGYTGRFSTEVFDSRAEEKHGDDMEAFATKAMEAHARLIQEARP